MNQRMLLGLIFMVLIGGVWLSPATPADAVGVNDTSTVRLYSGGVVVGEWTAQGTGRVEGDTLAFVIKDGIDRRNVRIRGTYSVELNP